MLQAALKPQCDCHRLRSHCGISQNTAAIMVELFSHVESHRMSSFLMLSFTGLRREVIKHLQHAPVEILDVLVGLVGKCIACRTAPNQFLGVWIEQVDDQRSDLVCLLSCR